MAENMFFRDLSKFGTENVFDFLCKDMEREEGILF